MLSAVDWPSRSIGNAEHIRRAFKRMVDAYLPHCPDADFQARSESFLLDEAWPAHLSDVFQKRGFALSKGNAEGPDLWVQKDSQVYAIEAVVPSLGAPSGSNTWDKPKEYPYYIDENKLILRITSVMEAKLNQYTKWRANGFPEKIPFIIAISTGCLPSVHDNYFYASLGEHVVYGEKIPAASLSNGVQIPLGFFCDSRFNPVSAILFTAIHFDLNHAFNGDDFILIHNPEALNPIPRHALKFGYEVWREAGQTHALNWTGRLPGCFAGVS